MNPPTNDDDDDGGGKQKATSNTTVTTNQRKPPPNTSHTGAENPNSSISSSLMYYWNENDPPLFHVGRYQKLRKLAVLKTTMKLPYESYQFNQSGILTLDDWFELVELHQVKLHQQQQAKEQKQLLRGPPKKKPKVPPPPPTVNPRTIIPGVQIRTHYHLDQDARDYRYYDVPDIECIRHFKLMWQWINIIRYKAKHYDSLPPWRQIYALPSLAITSSAAAAAEEEEVTEAAALPPEGETNRIDLDDPNDGHDDSDTHNDIHFRNLMKPDHLAYLLSIHNQVAISHLVILEIHVHTQSEAKSLLQSITPPSRLLKCLISSDDRSTTAINKPSHNSNVVVLPTTWFHINGYEPRSITDKLMYQNDHHTEHDTTHENSVGFIYDQLKPLVLSVPQWENENYPSLDTLPLHTPTLQESHRSAVVDHEVEIGLNKSQNNGRFLQVHDSKSFIMMELNEAREFIKPYEIQPKTTTTTFSSTTDDAAADDDDDDNVDGDNMTTIGSKHSKDTTEKKHSLLPFVRHHHRGLEDDRNTPLVTKKQKQECNEWGEPIDQNRRRIFAINCEMVETEMGKELSGVLVCEIISFEQVEKTESIGIRTMVLLDNIVQPYNRITNYLTKYSGVNASAYHDADNHRVVVSGPSRFRLGWERRNFDDDKYESQGSTCSYDILRLEQVQAVLLQLIHPCDIVIGHSLENALHALRFIHPTVIDTAILFQNQKTDSDNDNNTTCSMNSSSASSSTRSSKYSLQHLAAVLLQKEIQNPNRPHCSEENASTAIQLAVRRAVYGPSFGMNNTKVKSNNWFTKISYHPKNALTTVAVGPIEWLREHVSSPSSSPSNAIHALPCESIDDSNSKAIVRWVTGPTRRASVVWSKMELPKSSNDDSTALNRMIEWVHDVITKLSSNNSVVLMIPIQINFNGTKALNQQRQLRQCNPSSTLPWSDAEEKKYQESLEICRNGYVAYITTKSEQ